MASLSFIQSKEQRNRLLHEKCIQDKYNTSENYSHCIDNAIQDAGNLTGSCQTT